MTIPEINMAGVLVLSAAFTAGLALGAFYFIGLWQTVKHLSSTQSRARFMLISFVLRMIVLCTGFYFIMGTHWERLALALLGFIVIRKILTSRLGVQKEEQAAQ